MRANFSYAMEKENKEDGSPVTKTDLAINKMIIAAVKKYYPSHGVLAEEESYEHEGKEFVWLCDPVDGTIPFSHGIPISTFTLALVQNGEPIIGVIFDPFGKNLFFGAKGQGAYLNNKKIRVAEKTSLVSTIVFCEYWKQSPYKTLPIIEALENINCNVPILKSIAYGCGLVAAGEGAGVIFPGSKPWDIAAAKLIIEEAGGITSSFNGQNQRYDQEIQGFIGANKTLHPQLVELVKKHSSLN